MSKTTRGKKITYVHSYKKSNGSVVKTHYRSNPNKR